MIRRLATGVFVASLALGASGVVSGCVSPRNTLGTNSSPCFRAVPVASEAVHDRGTLAGVRLVGARELDRYTKLRDDLAMRVGHALRSVCVVSFHGDYRLDDVDKPLGHGPASGSGPVALVFVTIPQNMLVGTAVLEHEPLPIRHEV